MRRAALTTAAAAPALVCLLLASGCGASTPRLTGVFPVPGSRVASPRTQIVFRGAPIRALGHVTVTGSRSGAHGGRLEGDSDQDGGSFLPSRPFTPGETVTVRTSLTVPGHAGRSFRFHVATPARRIQPQAFPPPPRVAGDVARFRSRPDLEPPTTRVVARSGPSGSDDIFVANQLGPIRNGPMIIDPSGSLVWFHPVPRGNEATDFRVQQLGGRPVLTWWQGYLGAGVGVGKDIVYDTSYRQIAVVHAGNGLSADLHEFELTPAGTALITAYFPVYWNAKKVHGSRHAVVLDSVVQEIDLKTGLVLFQWDSLDHVPLTDAHVPVPSVKLPFDYFHVNSVQADDDGSLIVSARNTWAAYKIDHASGRVIWSLGGKRSSFKLGAGARFAFQHDVRVRSGGDGTVTLFDDGAGPPNVHKQSRGLTLALDPQKHTASVVRQLHHKPGLLAQYEGNSQVLENGDEFVGWGQQPYFTEFDPAGHTRLDLRFVDANTTYRAYRFPWTGRPRTAPRVAAVRSGSKVRVYASWNGATRVAAWRALGGRSAHHVARNVSRARQGFETVLTLPFEPYVAVQALDASGRVLASSATIHVR